MAPNYAEGTGEDAYIYEWGEENLVFLFIPKRDRNNRRDVSVLCCVVMTSVWLCVCVPILGTEVIPQS